MFNNLTKEIIYYSLIPVAVLFLIGLIILLIKKKSNNVYKYNYIIKVILMLIDSMVLSLIIGYSIWATLRFINNGTLASNIIHVIIFIVLIAMLIILLVTTCSKLFKSFNNKYDDWYEKETF